MEFFDDNVRPVKFPTDAAESLRHGFILFGHPDSGSAGFRVLTVVTPLPDATFAVKCTYLSFREQTASGTHMHDLRDLGYLTQAGADALSPHVHCRCDTRLELTATV